MLVLTCSDSLVLSLVFLVLFFCLSTFEDSLEVNRPLGSICGRRRKQDDQAAPDCTAAILDAPIGIGQAVHFEVGRGSFAFPGRSQIPRIAGLVANPLRF